MEFAKEDSDGWIAAAHPDPPALHLDLQLNDPFWSLERSQRLARAEQWQRRARSLGYEDLRLLDQRGLVVARTALVGSGMILLESPTAPPQS
jgi:hypothetical protein